MLFLSTKDIRTSTLILLLTIIMTSCDTFSEASNTQELAYPDLLIDLARAPCLGADCPVYDITIKGDGSVIYTGWKYVQVLESRQSQIPQEEIKELVKEFEAINFLESKSEQQPIVDCPITVITLRLESKRNTYYDYYVCGIETSQNLAVLEIGKRIDDVTNSKQWLGDAAVEMLERLAP